MQLFMTVSISPARNSLNGSGSWAATPCNGKVSSEAMAIKCFGIKRMTLFLCMKTCMISHISYWQQGQFWHLYKTSALARLMHSKLHFIKCIYSSTDSSVPYLQSGNFVRHGVDVGKVHRLVAARFAG